VTLLVVVVAVQLILLGYQVRSHDDVRLVRVWAVGAVTPVDKAADSVVELLSSTWQRYVWLINTNDENRRIRDEVTQLRLENLNLRRGLARFEREEVLVSYQNEVTSQTRLAHVIGVGPNRNAKEIFLDEGSSEGFRAGMAVITADGAVGKIQASYPGSSLVQLITDRDSGVGVILGNSRLHGVLKGRGEAECQVDYIGHEVKVEIGEAIFTSGDDRIFPKGFPVGEVVRLADGTDFQEIHVRPYASLDRLDEVLVITAGVHQDLPRLPMAQIPTLLMPPPDAPKPAVNSEPDSSDPVEVDDPSTSLDALETQLAPSAPGNVTDADRLRRRYQELARNQGHVYVEVTPTSLPPDFKIGQPISPATLETSPHVCVSENNPAPAWSAELP
jgi:rod shape-determining protein MreC